MQSCEKMSQILHMIKIKAYMLKCLAYRSRLTIDSDEKIISLHEQTKKIDAEQAQIYKNLKEQHDIFCVKLNTYDIVQPLMKRTEQYKSKYCQYGK